MMLVRPTGHRHGVTGEVPFGGPINGYSETPPSAAATDSTGLARDIARIAVGSGGLATLDNGDGQAALRTTTRALCRAGPTSAPRCPLPVESITLTDRSSGRQSP